MNCDVGGFGGDKRVGSGDAVGEGELVGGFGMGDAHAHNIANSAPSQTRFAGNMTRSG